MSLFQYITRCFFVHIISETSAETESFVTIYDGGVYVYINYETSAETESFVTIYYEAFYVVISYEVITKHPQLFSQEEFPVMLDFS